MRLLKKIDNYFYEHSAKDALYIYLLIAILIGFVMFYFIYPKAQEYSKKQQDLYSKLVGEKQNLETTKRVFEARIVLLNKKIKELTADLEVLKKQKTFYTELTSLLSFANFDQYKWAQLVKESVDAAKSEGMRVVKISNNIYDDKNATKHSSFLVKRMDMDIFLKGDYKNFIFYVYNFENRKDLIKVSEINVNSPTDYSLKISIYGFVK
ncbi:MAG: hypothetical protein GXO01_01115 [Epsilonproteobacteria bacterium]|nr:hypothetical protein [Campylobacterota bacterium]